MDVDEEVEEEAIAYLFPIQTQLRVYQKATYHNFRIYLCCECNPVQPDETTPWLIYCRF